MKLIATIALLCFSILASAQDMMFKLTGAKHKKWIGSTVFTSASDENFSNLTFYTNHTVVEESRKGKVKKKVTDWKMVNGAYMNDPQTVLQIGNKFYQLEFTITSNGKDFMTLTSMPERDDEDIVTKTYYAE